MATKPSIALCILAGGASRRFGSDKARALLGGKPLIVHVADRATAQTSGPVAINTNDSALCSELSMPQLRDLEWENAGPLAGIATAMSWAHGEGLDEVITVAVDQPFIPLDYVARLVADQSPSIAASNDRWHPVNGWWPVSMRRDLDAYLRSGKRSAHGWAEHCGVQIVAFEQMPGAPDPFWNVNHTEDMEQAQTYLPHDAR